MKLATVGVGDAGCRIVDRIHEYQRRDGRDLSSGNALAFNIARTAANDLESVPDQRHVVIGDTHGEIDGSGTDGDAELATAVARSDVHEIRRAFDMIEMHQVDGVLLVAGLGGGTGSGAGAVILEELQSMYDKPIYALGVLPAEDEGGRPARNAARALQSYVRTADNVVLFDNDAWDLEGGDESEFAEVNRELATRVVTLFAAGEAESSTIAENAVDSSDLIRTLATGGVSSIGYASTELERKGLLSRLLSTISGEEPAAETTDAAKIKALVRRATESALTLPCEVASAERVLVVLSGPPSELSRRGFESARYWLEQQADTVEVLAGDDPRERSSTLAATVLLSNVTTVPRIDAMQEQAVAAREDLAEQAPAQD